jgi:putative flippase GtrA
MDRFVRRLPRVERFVQLVVAGGLALLSGLWLTALFAVATPGWTLGVALALAGVAGLAAGIARELDGS